MVGRRKVLALCKILLLLQPLFASVKSHGDHKTVIRFGVSGHPLFLDITRFKTVVSVWKPVLVY